jgi:hypothetical protein
MTDDKPKVIENVYLAAIRQEDGAQLFTWGEGENECMWLNGVQRAYGIQVGEREADSNTVVVPRGAGGLS